MGSVRTTTHAWRMYDRWHRISHHAVDHDDVWRFLIFSHLWGVSIIWLSYLFWECATLRISSTQTKNSLTGEFDVVPKFGLLVDRLKFFVGGPADAWFKEKSRWSNKHKLVGILVLISVLVTTDEPVQLSSIISETIRISIDCFVTLAAPYHISGSWFFQIRLHIISFVRQFSWLSCGSLLTVSWTVFVLILLCRLKACAGTKDHWTVSWPSGRG